MKRKIIPYNPKPVPPARKLRNNSTLSEILLWQKLKNKQVLGYDFDRQKPVGNFIIDFFCRELLLAVEIDGDSHRFKGQEDLERQQKLEDKGIEFLRFDDLEVTQEIDRVVKTIKWKIRQLQKN